jgi:hypothetical protein
MGSLKKLRELLENNDFVPHELMAELMGALTCPVSHNKLLELQRQIDSFEYVRALKTLERVVCDQGHDVGGRGNAA